MTTKTSTTDKSPSKQRKSAQDRAMQASEGSEANLDSGPSSSTSEADSKVADKLLGNEMRTHKNRGFHDGYDAGKKATLQRAYDGSYEKAFEQTFILSTLKGVANALKSSHRNHMQQLAATLQESQSRPTSAISTSPSSAPSPTCSSSSISSNRSSTGGCYSSTNVSISSNHLSLLDSMKFDATSDIESIKKDLIKICSENRLEILAHYVSQIG